MMPESFAEKVNSSLSMSEDTVNLLSLKVNQARDSLLHKLRNQLAEPLAQQLQTQEQGVPFVNIDKDPPQTAAIKKVINCLYHAEQALIQWEQLDFKSALGIMKLPYKGIKALTQLYNSLALLNDATPEIQNLIKNNYTLLEPVFSSAYQLIEQSGLSAQFERINVVIEANQLVEGQETAETINTHPLVAFFSTLSQVMNNIAELQQSQLSDTEKKSKLESVRELIEQFNQISAMHRLSADGLLNSKPLQGLKEWFANIDEDRFMEQYATWTRLYLPTLAISIDQLERRNYLRSGTLSQEFFSALNQVNEGLSPDEQVIDINTLQQVREEQIHLEQVEHVTVIEELVAQQNALTEFFSVLRLYAGKAFSTVTEDHRHQLRQIYPKVQWALAHEHLDLEHQLTDVLNTTGGTEDKSWGVFFRAQMSYLVSNEVDKVLAKKDALENFVTQQIQAEHLKIEVAEKAREFLGTSSALSFDERVEHRIQEIQAHVSADISQPTVILAGNLVAVKESDLKNLRGNIAFLQEQNFSIKINTLRVALFNLLQAQNPTDTTIFSNQPYHIEQNESALIQQVKQVANSLLTLEQSLIQFEQKKYSQGRLAISKSLLGVVSSAYKLNASMQSLSSETKEYLAPLLKKMEIYFAVLSKVNEEDQDLSQLKEESFLTEEQAVILINNPPQTLPSEEVEGHSSSSSLSNTLIKIHEFRTLLLEQVQATLSKPISSYLMAREEGVPFINFDKEPPQIIAIKKIINSFYYVESSLKRLQTMEASGSKVSLAAQGVLVMTQLSKSFNLLKEAAPEVQNLLVDSYDFIKPLFLELQQKYQDTMWFKQINHSEIGSILGQGINRLLPSNQTSFSFAHLISELPSLLHGVATQIESKHDTSSINLRVVEKKIKAIDSIVEMVAEDELSLKKLVKGRSAYKGLTKICMLLAQESNELQITTLASYQKWVKEEYPALLVFLDELEIHYYLQAGILSKPVIDQIDAINKYLNNWILSYDEASLEKIDLASDLAETRVKSLEELKKAPQDELFKIKGQLYAVHEFFAILERHQDKSLVELPLEDKKNLKIYFIEFQQIITDINLDTANQLINYFNELECSIDKDEVIKLKDFVIDSLTSQERKIQLKIDVVLDSLAQHKETGFFNEEHLATHQWEKVFKEKARVSEETPQVLSSVQPSSFSIRTNLEAMQQLNLSSVLTQLKTYVIKSTREHLSDHVQVYLQQSGSESNLHIINSTDPYLIKQIKTLENNLTHLEASFLRFESLKGDESLLTQAKLFLDIGFHAQQLVGNLQNLSRELQEHYGPLIDGIFNLSSKISSWDYRALDTQDMRIFLYGDENNSSAWLKSGAKLISGYLKTATEQTEKVSDYLKERHSPVNDQPVTENISLTVPNKIYVNLARQIKFFETQMNELGRELKDVVHMKRLLYKEYLFELSRKEEELYLKPGTLLDQGMVIINQFFLSVALELNIPLQDKLDLLNDAYFIEDLISDIENDLSLFVQQLAKTPQNEELQLKVTLTKDKLNSLQQQYRFHLLEDPREIKSILLDAQFAIYLRQHANNSSLKSPILEQYKQALEEGYATHKEQFLSAKHSIDDLSGWMKSFDRSHLGDYFMVDQGIRQLQRLKSSCVKSEVLVTEYLEQLIDQNCNQDDSVNVRAQALEKLPVDKVFNKTIGTLSRGENFLAQFKLFIKTALSSIAEAVSTGKNIVDVYHKNKTDKIIQNIERQHSMKKEIHVLRTNKEPELSFVIKPSPNMK